MAKAVPVRVRPSAPFELSNNIQGNSEKSDKNLNNNVLYRKRPSHRGGTSVQTVSNGRVSATRNLNPCPKMDACVIVAGSLRKMTGV